MEKSTIRNINLIRIVLIISVLISSIYNRGDNTTYGTIALLVLLVLSNIIIYITQSQKLRIGIILLNFPLFYYICVSLKPSFFTVAALITVDVFLLENQKLRMVSIFAILLLLIQISFQAGFDFNSILQSVVFVIVFAILMDLLTEERKDKILAHELYDRLRQSEEKLIQANKELELQNMNVEELTTLKERNRISREIHDSVGHSLSTIIIQLGAISRLIKDSPAALAMTKNLESFTKESLDKVRMVVRDMKPDEYKNIDSVILINRLIEDHKKNTGIDVSFSFSNERWPLNDNQSSSVYRLVQEFLVNSLKHSNANKINIIMLYSDENLNITLKDNGTGKSDFKKGFGLTSMKERVFELGGFIRMNLDKEEGFRCEVSIPKKEKMKIYSQIEGEE